MDEHLFLRDGLAELAEAVGPTLERSGNLRSLCRNVEQGARGKEQEKRQDSFHIILYYMLCTLSMQSYEINLDSASKYHENFIYLHTIIH